MAKSNRAKKLKRKQLRKAQQREDQRRRNSRGAATSAEPREKALRPTVERLNHGNVKIPQGIGKHENPAMVLDHDQIAILREEQAITYEQEQAARTFQEASRANRLELGISTGRSCLDIGPVGHDGGDGNPEVTKRYNDLCAAMGLFQRNEVIRVAIDGLRPRRLQLLRDGLSAMEGK